MMSASQHIRRIVSAGSGLASAVSAMPWSCSPVRRVSRSISTITSGTRRVSAPAGTCAVSGRVISSTRVSAWSWSNVRSGSCWRAWDAATAASRVAATRASVSASSWRWVWHIPVVRSTQRRTLRWRRLRACLDRPSSPDRIRSRRPMSRLNASTDDVAALAISVACRAASSLRPAASRLRGGAGDGVDVSGRQVTGGEGGVDVGQQVTGPGASSHRTGVAGRAAPAVGDHIRRARGNTRRGQLAGALGDRHIDGVQPRPHPPRHRDQRRQPGGVTGSDVDAGEVPHVRLDRLCKHVIITSNRCCSVNPCGPRRNLRECWLP